MKSQFVILPMIFTCCLLAFNNCGQPGEIQVKDQPPINELASTTVVQDILTNCDKARRSGNLRSSNQDVVFEDTRTETGRARICEFASGDNLSMQDTLMRARYEQSQTLNLPAGAVICDVTMQNDLQRFKYDDVFFFTFNGHLLATNNKTSVRQKLTPITAQTTNQRNINFYNYNWLSLRNAPFVNQRDDFCIGKDEGLSTCSWPVTEQQGQIQFSFAPEILVRMSGNVSAQNQTFGFVITGDNDADIDCFHERLQFSMKVDYYIQ